MEKAILQTLGYHDIFDYPLTSEELYLFLVTEDSPSYCFFKKVLSRMVVNDKRIDTNNKYYFLNGRKKIIKLREKRGGYSQEKLKIAQRVGKCLRWVPTIKMLGVTGAVAVRNAKGEDDIDFLVVTAKNRLWMTRLMVILLMEAWGKRRRPADKKVKNKICLNIFLDEASLRIPKAKRNLFVAHEIGQMEIIYDKGGVYRRFLKANKWARVYLPNALKVKSQKSKVKSFSKKLKSKNMLYFFEKIAYWVQLGYMKRKMTGELVSLRFAFFHPDDVGGRLIDEYDKKIKLLIADPPSLKLPPSSRLRRTGRRTGC